MIARLVNAAGAILANSTGWSWLSAALASGAARRSMRRVNVATVMIGLGLDAIAFGLALSAAFQSLPKRSVSCRRNRDRLCLLLSVNFRELLTIFRGINRKKQRKD